VTAFWAGWWCTVARASGGRDGPTTRRPAGSSPTCFLVVITFWASRLWTVARASGGRDGPTTRRPAGSRRGASMGRGRSGARAGAGESLRLTSKSLSAKRASCSKIPRIRACPRRPRRGTVARASGGRECPTTRRPGGSSPTCFLVVLTSWAGWLWTVARASGGRECPTTRRPHRLAPGGFYGEEGRIDETWARVCNLGNPVSPNGPAGIGSGMAVRRRPTRPRAEAPRHRRGG